MTANTKPPPKDSANPGPFGLRQSTFVHHPVGAGGPDVQNAAENGAWESPLPITQV